MVALARDGVEHVRHGGDPGEQRDLLARSARWVAGPVPALVVRADDGLGARAEIVSSRRNSSPSSGVLHHQLPLVRRERAGLVDEPGRQRELADVLEEQPGAEVRAATSSGTSLRPIKRPSTVASIECSTM